MPGRHADDGAEVGQLEADGLRARAASLAAWGELYLAEVAGCGCDECRWLRETVALVREVAGDA